MRHFYLAILTTTLLLCSSAQAIAPRGSRLLGMEINYTTPASDYYNNVVLAKSAGAEYVSLLLPWNLIEPIAPSTCEAFGAYTDPGNALSIFNYYLPKFGLKLSLTIAMINTNIDARPRNLRNLPVDHELIKCRYAKMLKFVFSRIPSITLTSFQVSNEVDAIPMAYSTDFWSRFASFVLSSNLAVKSIRANTKVSFTSTLAGTIGKSGNPYSAWGLQIANYFTDLVVVTYYPLAANFVVQTPLTVANDVDTLMALYSTPRYPTNKQVSFNEVGCHTGSIYDQSSELIQKQFISDFFTAWDKYSTRIVSALVFQMNDLSYSAAQEMATMYGLGTHKGFIEYLQTLGLRTYDGRDKLGFKQLKYETSSRLWWFYFPPSQ